MIEVIIVQIGIILTGINKLYVSFVQEYMTVSEIYKKANKIFLKNNI